MEPTPTDEPTPAETTPPPAASTPTADPPAAPAPAAAAGELTDDDRNLAMLGHLLGAFTSFVGPLIIWLLKKDESAFVAQESRESLNFQITVVIGYLIITPIAVITCGVGGLLYPVLAVVALVFSILAAVKAKDGIAYRYPATLRLVK